MITDKFKVIDCVAANSTNHTAQLICNECANTFDVHFNIVKPLNCLHVVGKSVTVVCPYCGNNATKTTTANNEDKIVELTDKITKYFGENEIIFKVVDDPDMSTFSVPVRCTKCEERFTLGMLSGLNCDIDVNANVPTITMTCPACGMIEKMTKTQAEERFEVMQNILELTKLKGENGAFNTD